MFEDGTRVLHLLMQQETADAPADPETFAKRALCYLLLDRIPASGVAEVFDTLRAVYDYYAHAPEIVALPPTTSKRTARVGRTYERPAFVFGEE